MRSKARLTGNPKPPGGPPGGPLPAETGAPDLGALAPATDGGWGRRLTLKAIESCEGRRALVRHG